ncbi:hypothetical protein [Granulicella paludicola]|uniref:hypothetical protein n=1 Tax=Granulicella paludicola TaxID=474951 RepID=UPI0021DF4372|nr:hypothetical protein [Granulicella paludicola]
MADGKFSKDQLVETILEDSGQYAALLRRRDQEDRRRGGVFYFAFVFLVALVGVGLVWVSH